MYRTALARTHRPRRFAELVGQDHVAATLRAAVESERVAHAYLFCGPRGIGKTTAARVLAMALNCPRREDGEPCGECESCTGIWAGRVSLDVVEIDAASNRGVDDARDLRERAMYAPSDESRYKVYIVDEAHMLTREAWNALLKILEEPPPRVIFVFATTEPQKIRQSAAPVLSRCQRFDFHRVSVADLMGRLQAVLGAEGVVADEDTLRPIARRAEGGVRDALSLLDQVLSFSGDAVTRDDVRRMLGLVDEERYLEFLRLARGGDQAGVFPFVQALLDDGHDLAEFVQGLGDTLRTVLALRLDPGADPVELGEGSRERLLEAGEPFAAEELLRMLVGLADFEAAGRVTRSAQPRIQVEVLLLRLVSLESSVELRELLEAIGPRPPHTEPREANGPMAAPATQTPDAPPSAAPVHRSASPRGSAPSRESGGPGPEGEDVVRTAWRKALEAARGSAPQGQLVGLRGATVSRYEDGVLHLRVPAGLAADLDAYLGNERRSATLREEFARRLDAEPGSIRFTVSEADSRERITAESARDQRLQRMIEADPRLKEAVETLDLKLTEE